MNKLSCSELPMIRFYSFSLLITFTCKLAQNFVLYVRSKPRSLVIWGRFSLLRILWCLKHAFIWQRPRQTTCSLRLTLVWGHQFCLSLARIASAVPWNWYGNILKPFCRCPNELFFALEKGHILSGNCVWKDNWRWRFSLEFRTKNKNWHLNKWLEITHITVDFLLILFLFVIKIDFLWRWIIIIFRKMLAHLDLFVF